MNLYFRNKYYGGESASITPLDDLFAKFGIPNPDETYGRGRLVYNRGSLLSRRDPPPLVKKSFLLPNFSQVIIPINFREYFS